MAAGSTNLQTNHSLFFTLTGFRFGVPSPCFKLSPKGAPVATPLIDEGCSLFSPVPSLLPAARHAHPSRVALPRPRGPFACAGWRSPAAWGSSFARTTR